MQSTSLHAAIIMDGNGRWALARGRRRAEGHLAGAEAARRVVRAAPAMGVRVLTLYAFSSDNWQRPTPEVEGLLALLLRFFQDEWPACRDSGVRLTSVGRRDRLPLSLRAAIATAERATASGDRLWLRLAIDYSARGELLRATQQLAKATVRDRTGPEAITRTRLSALLGASPDVDLLIRTGGERRLSDFLLWEAAYAELFFSDTPWPDFGETELAEAVSEYRRRDRRFGRVADGRGA